MDELLERVREIVTLTVRFSVAAPAEPVTSRRQVSRYTRGTESIEAKKKLNSTISLILQPTRPHSHIFRVARLLSSPRHQEKPAISRGRQRASWSP